MSDRLCVVMPVYNEQDAIGPVLEKWANALEGLGVDYVIRPYNDGSKDKSLAVMRAVAERLPRVEVRDKTNGGHGNTILTGYRDAVADGFDWVFQIDSDDEMGPEKFGELWRKRGDYDFLVGIRDGRVQQLPRKVISFVSRLCVRIFYGKSVWDVNTPYRLMRVTAFKDFYSAIPLTTFAPNVILSGLAALHKLRCYEIRVPQHDRMTGEVSIKKWKLLKAAVRSFMQTIVFSFSCSVRGPIAVLVAGLAFFLGAQSPYFKVTQDVDPQVYFLSGKLTSAGKLLYVDFFDHKGPFFHYLNRLGYQLTNDYWGMWIIEGSLIITALILLFIGLRKWGPGRSMAICLGLLCCVPIMNRPESLTVWLSVLALALTLLCDRVWIWFVVGMIGACCFFSKQTCIGMFVGFGVYHLVGIKSPGRKERFVSYVLGGLVTTAAIVACLFINGNLAAFWDCCFRFNANYAGKFQSREFFRGMYLVVKQCAPLLIMAGACLLVLAKQDKKFYREVRLAWLVYLLWEAFFLVRTGKLFPYQFVGLYVCLYLSVIIVLKCSKMNSGLLTYLYTGLFLMLALPVGMDLTLRVVHRSSHIQDERRIREFLEDLSGLPPAKLFVWGNRCQLYADSGRECPVRYHYWILNPWFDANEENGIFSIFDKEKDLIIVDAATLFQMDHMKLLSETDGEVPFKRKLRHYVQTKMRKVPTRVANGCVFVKGCEQR